MQTSFIHFSLKIQVVKAKVTRGLHGHNDSCVSKRLWPRSNL